MNKDLQLLEQLVDELLKNIDRPIGEDDWAGTGATLVADDVEMLKRVLSFIRAPKVWVLSFEDVVEYTTQTRRLELFFDREKAKKEYDSLVESNRYDFVLTHGFVIDETDDHFEAYEDGFYSKDHFSVSLREITIN